MNYFNNKKIHSLSAAIGTAVLALGALPASAADDAKKSGWHSIEEVVVFARKREESVQDVPLSVTALSGDAIAKIGLGSAMELTKVSPNLTTNSAYGETQPNYSMRGISVANEFNPNQASPIGVYVDESYMSNRISHGLALFDVERIEVLRGPQGTLYGRNTTGGAISVFTRKPTLDAETSGYLEAGIGNFNRTEVNAAFDATLNEPGTVGMRVAIKSLKADGSIENLHPGKPDSSSADTLAGRLTLRFQPSDAFDSTLALYSGRNKPTSAAVFSQGVDGQGNPTPGGVNPLTGYSRDHLDFFENEMEEAGEYQTSGQGALLRMQWSLSDAVELTSVTSWDEGDQDLDFDADGSPVDLLTDKWLADFEQFNQELRANIEVSDAVSLVLGAYYGQDDVHIDYHNSFLAVIPAFAFQSSADSLQQRDSMAVFADTDIELTDKLMLSTGLRWTRDSIQVTDYYATYAGAVTIGPDYSTPEETSSEVTGRVALNYQFTEALLGYAYYSRGYRGGAFNAVTSSGLQSLTFVEPEFVDTYEAGLKYQTDDRRFTLNSAVFYNDYQDQQLQELVNAVSYLRNAGKSTLQGAEFELTYALTQDLTVSGSLGYLDATYDELTLKGQDFSGNELPFAPEFTGNIGLDWYITRVRDVDVSAYLNASYIADQYFSPFNEAEGNQLLQEDGYWNVDANMRFEAGDVYATVWVKNMLEDEHFVYGIDTKSLGYSYLVQGAPRTFGINMGVRF